MKRIRFVVLLAVFVSAFAFQAFTAQAYPVSGFSRIYEGVEYATGYATSPRLMRAFAIRVSLLNPDVSMYASHSNGSAAYEVTRETTAAFLSSHGMKAAVNACYFNGALSPNTNIEGLLVSNGSVVSTWQTARDAEIRFTADKIASIANNGGTAGVYNGLAGDAWHLVNGNPLGDNSTTHPRTSAGLSQGGEYLILVVVDGRQPGWSDGATIYDMSLWQQSFGAYNAINFDGGGSSTMVRADVGTVNSPSDGVLRSVGASLGVASTSKNAQGPSACSMNANRIDMVMRGNMNHVILKTWTSSGGWAAPVDLGGTTYDSPAIVSRADGYLHVFIRGGNNQLYEKYWTAANGWSGWHALGGNIISGPAASFRDADHMDVVARGSDSSVHHIYWNANGWGPWESLSGVTYDSPAIVSRDSTHISVFCRGTTNNLHEKTWTSGVGWDASWQNLGGSLSSGPAVCSRDADHINVFFRGANNDLQQIYWFSGTGWSEASSLEGGLAGKPAVCSRDANKIDTWVRGGQDHQFQKSWNSTDGWYGAFVDQGYMF